MENQDSHEEVNEGHGVNCTRESMRPQERLSQPLSQLMMLVTTAVLCDLLDGVEGEITQVSGDGAYDQHKCYEKASHSGTKTTIPPRKNAVYGEHGNCRGTPHPVR